MEEAQQDQYEERLKEVFDSFDASGLGSLCLEELTELCQALHLGDSTPALLHCLLPNEGTDDTRVNFEQFKEALIHILSAAAGESGTQQEEPQQPDSPKVHPKFVKGGKRYGRRSTPERGDSLTGFSDVVDTRENSNEAEDRFGPKKRECWNTHASRAEEYEAEGQLHLWNPDEPGTPRGSATPLWDKPEGRVRGACEDLGLPLDGYASRTQLLCLCEHLGLEVTEDVLRGLDDDEGMNVQDFLSRVVKLCQPATPSASTPYRQLKRHHSQQPFDEMGRRITTPSALTSTIGLRLFSSLDDGTGYTHAEYILDAWLEEGIDDSPEILQALDFALDAKINLGELTAALENELLITKNGLHQAALASFKAEIRHLLERVDHEFREKDRFRADLEKAEKLKSQMAAEIDEHHSTIERMNDHNLRKMEQEHKDKLAAIRAELAKERDFILQQSHQQHEELEMEMEKLKEETAYLRDRLSLTMKENGRLEAELLDNAEKLVNAENLICNLQANLNNILREKFGDLDPESAEFFLQEERLKQLRNSCEEQCRELQDRIDELQAELEVFRSMNRGPHPFLKPYQCDELESTSPGMESDQGLGSEENQPFNMSLEAEMVVEQLKAQHLREVESVRGALESKVRHYKLQAEEQKVAHEEQKNNLSLKCQEKVQALQHEMHQFQSTVEVLQNQLVEAQVVRVMSEKRKEEDQKELEKRHEGEKSSLKLELLQSQTQVYQLQDILETMEHNHSKIQDNYENEMKELRRYQEQECLQLEVQHENELTARLEEQRDRMLLERDSFVKKLTDDFQIEKDKMQQSNEVLKGSLENERHRCLLEFEEQKRLLIEEWERERSKLTEQYKVEVQILLEEERQVLLKDHEYTTKSLKEQWEMKRVQLQSEVEEIHTRLTEEITKLRELHSAEESRLAEDFDKEKLQLEELYEGILQARVEEEREKLQGKWKENEERFVGELQQEKLQLVERHKEVIQELIAKHCEEKEHLSGQLKQLQEDILVEREELEKHFSHRMKEVETRLSGDHEAMSERYYTDVSNLELQYQRELDNISERHAEEEARWQSEVEKMSKTTEKEKQELCRCFELEKELITQTFIKDKELLQESHMEEVKSLVIKNEDLQKRLDGFISTAQQKEIELSGQLNELHSRLQETLTAKEELLAQSEKKVEELELLLGQALDDFEQEKEELQDNVNNLEEKNKAIMALLESRGGEREKLLIEIHELKVGLFEKEAQINWLVELKESFEKMRKEKDCSEGQIGLLQKRVVFLESELERLRHTKKPEVWLEMTTPGDQIGQCVSVEQDKDTDINKTVLHQQANESEEECTDLNIDTTKVEEQEAQLEPEDVIQDVDEDGENLEGDSKFCLQAKYEECMCEIVRLTEQNQMLEERRHSIEKSKILITEEFQSKHATLQEDMARLKEENIRLLDKVTEQQKQEEAVKSILLDKEMSVSEFAVDQTFQGVSCQVESKIQAVSDLEDCCIEFERQNAKLRRALANLQDKSLKMHKKIEVHRSEAGRLTKENQRLRHRISLLKEKDFKDNDDERLCKAEHVKKQKVAGPRKAENTKRQVSERQMKTENGLRLDKFFINGDSVEEPAAISACISALEKELAKAQDNNTFLEQERAHLTQEICVLSEKVSKLGVMERQLSLLHARLSTMQEKFQVKEDALQAVNLQSSRIRSELRVTQQEKESLKQEVISLRKQLHNASDKILDMMLHSTGYQTQHKNLYWDEMARLVAQEQQLLQQENERLLREVHNTKSDVIHCQDKVRQHEATIVSLKQQKRQQSQSGLKREMDSLHKDMIMANGKAAGEHAESPRHMELLRQENEGLKSRLLQVEAQLLQLGGGQPRCGDEAGGRAADTNAQEEQESKMLQMEERMQEVELKLRNVKLLLQEKVSQLKEQLHKNGKAEIVIKDLYVENSQLLKALEMTEQRKKVAEKKSYLLEEKIASLNKIVRDLSPSPLVPLPNLMPS